MLDRFLARPPKPLDLLLERAVIDGGRTRQSPQPTPLKGQKERPQRQQECRKLPEYTLGGALATPHSNKHDEGPLEPTDKTRRASTHN